jgi:peptidoglycan hydrolase CwlO-like protein
MIRLEKFALKTTKWIGSIESLIIHTVLFIISLLLYLFGADFTRVLLVLTTIVSLEAIYLSIFIQMSVNHQSKALENVTEDVGEISNNVEGIVEDVGELQKDVDELQESINDDEEDSEDKSIKKIEDVVESLLKEIKNFETKLKAKK